MSLLCLPTGSSTTLRASHIGLIIHCRSLEPGILFLPLGIEHTQTEFGNDRSTIY